MPTSKRSSSRAISVNGHSASLRPCAGAELGDFERGAAVAGSLGEAKLAQCPDRVRPQVEAAPDERRSDLVELLEDRRFDAGRAQTGCSREAADAAPGDDHAHS